MPSRAGIGIPIAALLDMLIPLGVWILAFLWVGGIVAICCICAAGGAADARTEEWYAEHGQADKPAPNSEKGAA